MASVRHRIWRWAPGAIALTFVCAFALFGGAQTNGHSRVQPAVAEYADDHRGEDVPVIVQTDGDTKSAAARIVEIGGKVKQELELLSVIEADIPFEAISELSQSEAIEWVSLNVPVDTAEGGIVTGAGQVSQAYAQSIGAGAAWSQGFQGQGVAVAVVDTGISPATHPDFVDSTGATRVVAQVETNSETVTVTDPYGHGTHIAGIIGGDGDKSAGRFVGVAPKVNLVSVRISDDTGGATLGDLLAGLEWVGQNHEAYNIRVVNLSLHSSVAESYQTSPLSAAVETLWFRGVFVVVAAGNNGLVADSVHYPPVNDPFVMTVGSIDDAGTADSADDTVSFFSSRGTTQDGFAKPELYSPGAAIVSVAETNSIIFEQLKLTGAVVQAGDKYLKLSGTSMAAGAMSGGAALVFQAHPDWTPGEVKCTLIAYSRTVAGVSVPDIGAITAAAAPACNSDTDGLQAEAFGQMLKAAVVAWILDQPDPAAAAASIGFEPFDALGDVTSLEEFDWSAIKWNTIKWSAIKWGSVDFDAIKWSAIKWSAIKWSEFDGSDVNFDAIKWSAIKWSAIKWSAIKWSAIKWGSVDFDAIKWSSIKWSHLDDNKVDPCGVLSTRCQPLE